MCVRLGGRWSLTPVTAARSRPESSLFNKLSLNRRCVSHPPERQPGAQARRQSRSGECAIWLLLAMPARSLELPSSGRPLGQGGGPRRRCVIPSANIWTANRLVWYAKQRLSVGRLLPRFSRRLLSVVERASDRHRIRTAVSHPRGP